VQIGDRWEVVMMILMRARLAAVIALAATFATVPASSDAAPPVNDDIRSATVITSTPATFRVSTREATASPVDGRCVYGASVWYRFRPAFSQTLRLTTLGSNYDTVLAVFRGPRAARTLVACRDDTNFGLFSAVQLRFDAGRTYWLAASRCCSDARRGRDLDLRIYPPVKTTVTTSVDEVLAGDVSGRLTVRATTACVPRAAAFVNVRASQRVGDGVARATGGVSLPLCSTPGQSWAVTLDSETAVAFREGRVRLTVHSEASDGIGVASQDTDETSAVGLDPNGRRLL
jgi:hypothetical protein